MEKNSYFVIAYRILTYLQNCFMSGERPDKDFFGPEALEINPAYWANVMESLYNEGYINGIRVVNSIGGISGIKLMNLKITQKGMEYLQENSMMAKAREFLKTQKETVPGI